MIKHGKKLWTAFLLVAVVLITAQYASSAMNVFLKNGQVVQVPVNKEDIIGISFDGGSLPSDHKTTGANLPVTGGLVMWLDSSDITSLFRNTDGSSPVSSGNEPVGLWRDKSGNDNHFKQPNRSAQPRLIKLGIGGNSSVMFNTSQSMMSTANFGAPATVLYVARQTGGANGRVLSAAANNWLLGYWSGAKNQAFYQGWVSPQGKPATDDSPHYFTGIVRGQGQNSEVWADGILVSANQNGVAGPNQLGINLSIQVGAYAAEPSNCQVAEIIVYNEALSLRARQIVEAYLKTKWGIGQ
jgi:hypothetical protein